MALHLNQSKQFKTRVVIKLVTKMYWPRLAAAHKVKICPKF